MKPALYILLLTIYDICVVGASSFGVVDVLAPVAAFFLIAKDRKKLIFWLFGLNIFILFVAVSYVLNGDYESAKVVMIRSNLILLLTLSFFIGRDEWFLLKGFYKLKFSRKFISIVFISSKLTNLLLKSAFKIPMILKIRGVNGGLLFYKAYAGALARMVCDMLDKSYRIYKTMGIRGYSGDIVFIETEDRINFGDILVIVLVMLVLAIKGAVWML
ncbi:Uncharacterised protein [Oligella ureolytica]|uniref:ABC-type cobalt transport system, permease component CbiQ and related transporters n=1 Tax=Oligella ureolytica TaxID=90244 RepID=A0A378XFV6_9BURK|nr:hypothetical protein [Oligella ureolytica]QPT40761.1 hypothetical protein I6G29_04075 [Oligella ureolytica]SUA52660.1 Uncharacterised protein [Oligella ureolytica]SUA58168.1 Uncharacterised protein [Oligella ureolytica]